MKTPKTIEDVKAMVREFLADEAEFENIVEAHQLLVTTMRSLLDEARSTYVIPDVYYQRYTWPDGTVKRASRYLDLDFGRTGEATGENITREQFIKLGLPPEDDDEI